MMSTKMLVKTLNSVVALTPLDAIAIVSFEEHSPHDADNYITISIKLFAS